MKVTLQGIKSQISSAKETMKQSFKDAREYNRENNVFKEIKRTVDDIKECYEKGNVYTAGVTDDSARAVLDTSKQGLEAYAKAKNLNICFHTPQKPYECGSRDFEKPLTVTVESKGGFFGNDHFVEKVIDGDVKNTTLHTTQKTVKVGDSQREVTSSYEDSFSYSHLKDDVIYCIHFLQKHQSAVISVLLCPYQTHL